MNKTGDGAIVAASQGRKHAVATPCCDFLAALVKFKEQQTLNSG